MGEEHDILISYGGEVKALEDGRVGGYLVRFSGPDDPDLMGDFFAPDTDFGTAEKSAVLYQHGMDAKIGKRRLGDGTLRRDEVGIWIEAQLQLADEYQRAIYELARAGKLGWSSGTAAHLVEREPVADGVYKIVSWPLGLDASLTPQPAEPRNTVIPLKSLLAEAAGSRAGDEPSEAQPEQPAQKRGEEMTEEIKNAVAEQPQEQPAPQNAAPAAPAIDPAAFEEIKAELGKLREMLAQPVNEKKAAPAVLKTGIGDTYAKALKHWLLTGDQSGLQAYKASNPTDMVVGTDAAGGYAVPTGHFEQIIARVDEMSLPAALGVRRIPGVGTTVNVPLDAEDDGEFVSTAEAGTFDKDTPALGQKALTLVKYTKNIPLSIELLQDEESRLEAFLTDFVARGMAKTLNNLLLTEVAANGTALKTFASNSAIAAGEPEDIVFNDALAPYLDDSGSVAWVMRPATFGAIASITGSDRLYAETPGGSFAREILGYRVFYSNKAAAIGSNAKSVYFGNWNFVGWRMEPGLTLLRDPYSEAATGQINLWYYFRTVFGVLQAEAIGYGVHPV